MKLIYSQPYSKNRKRLQTLCYYGKAPKGIFKWDVIKIRLPGDSCKKCGSFIYITPDEAADFIRALSAGLHHFLTKHPIIHEIIKDKSL